MPLVGSQAGTIFPGGIDSLNAAYDPDIGPALQQVQGSEGFFAPNTLANITSQSIPDLYATTVVTLTAGSVFQTPLYLRAGQTVTNLSYYNGASASSTPTNQWVGLAFPAGLSGATATAKCVAISADGTTTVHAANTLVTTALSAPYVVPTSGYYIAFVCVAATTGPTASAGVTMGTVGRGAFAPWPAGVADTGKTTAYAVGATVGATTAASAALLMYAN
jgi:hypothetical protein